jgi:hypothetical protein
VVREWPGGGTLRATGALQAYRVRGVFVGFHLMRGGKKAAWVSCDDTLTLDAHNRPARVRVTRTAGALA